MWISIFKLTIIIMGLFPITELLFCVVTVLYVLSSPQFYHFNKTWTNLYCVGLTSDTFIFHIAQVESELACNGRFQMQITCNWYLQAEAFIAAYTCNLGQNCWKICPYPPSNVTVVKQGPQIDLEDPILNESAGNFPRH